MDVDEDGDDEFGEGEEARLEAYLRQAGERAREEAPSPAAIDFGDFLTRMFFGLRARDPVWRQDN